MNWKKIEENRKNSMLLFINETDKQIKHLNCLKQNVNTSDERHCFRLRHRLKFRFAIKPSRDTNLTVKKTLIQTYFIVTMEWTKQNSSQNVFLLFVSNQFQFTILLHTSRFMTFVHVSKHVFSNVFLPMHRYLSIYKYDQCEVRRALHRFRASVVVVVCQILPVE